MLSLWRREGRRKKGRKRKKEESFPPPLSPFAVTSLPLFSFSTTFRCQTRDSWGSKFAKPFITRVWKTFKVFKWTGQRSFKITNSSKTLAFPPPGRWQRVHLRRRRRRRGGLFSFRHPVPPSVCRKQKGRKISHPGGLQTLCHVDSVPFPFSYVLSRGKKRCNTWTSAMMAEYFQGLQKN